MKKQLSTIVADTINVSAAGYSPLKRAVIVMVKDRRTKQYAPITIHVDPDDPRTDEEVRTCFKAKRKLGEQAYRAKMADLKLANKKDSWDMSLPARPVLTKITR